MSRVRSRGRVQEYSPTRADRAPMPARYGTEPRYLGYRDHDLDLPYARFFEPSTRPVQPHVLTALASGMAPTEYGHPLDEVADRLSAPGYEPLETGWTRRPDGVVVVHVLTHMPGATAQMWDWWFGWHGTESARYKLWYPDAHVFSAMGEDRSADRTLTDRQHYLGNVSYVDEYIGGELQRLAIRFFDPARAGFVVTSGTTYVCARVGLSSAPISFGWLVHQVRATDDGAEMRSRFFLNDAAVLAIPASSMSGGRAAALLSSTPGRAAASALAPSVVSRLLPDTLGPDMVVHCASEMNHLAGFLPQLYEEFNGTR